MTKAKPSKSPKHIGPQIPTKGQKKGSGYFGC
jgi:hypothetical protein